MKVAYSLIIDNSPIFLYHGWLLINSLIKNCTINPKDIFVNYTPAVNTSWRDKLNSLELKSYELKPFGDGKYCNKAAQLDNHELFVYDYVILLDTDMFFLENIEGILSDESIKGKIVDLPNPSLETLKELYKNFDLPDPKYLPTDQVPEELTFNGNFNGGLYIIPNRYLQTIQKNWKKWIEKLIDNPGPLKNTEKIIHIDQIAFSLAINEKALPLENLETAYNCPTHIQLKNDVDAKVLHHHGKISDTGLLITPKFEYEYINKSIIEANTHIGEFFDDFIFWEYRYFTNPDLGSGIGSRGEILQHKKGFLVPILNSLKEEKILDVGCGDLEVIKTADIEKYTGLDISSEAIKIAKLKRPDWNFIQGEIHDIKGEYQLVMCLDVLIHQPTYEVYYDLVKHIIEASTHYSIIGAYRKKPEYSSKMTFYYESIIDTVAKIDSELNVEVIEKYRDISIVFLSKNNTGNPNDISSGDLIEGLKKSSNPRLLRRFVEFSREKLNFFPRTTIRLFEYPWLIESVQNYYKRFQDLKILDIGAGVCALPLWISGEGAHVTTVDYHSMIRKVSDKGTWNEWGYFDYSTIDDKINSYNQDAAKFKIEEKQNVIYSISVLEHMPAVTRRKILKNCSEWLLSAGIFILTFDLIPNTDKLWNLSEGQEVENPNIHGTIDDIKNEILNLNFTINFESVERNIFKSRTDVYYIIAEKR